VTDEIVSDLAVSCCFGFTKAARRLELAAYDVSGIEDSLELHARIKALDRALGVRGCLNDVSVRPHNSGVRPIIWKVDRKVSSDVTREQVDRLLRMHNHTLLSG
jgi:hypothetical protein